MNPYASYAATAVDLSGTNHIIWENNGQLIHACYDSTSGTWDQARPVSNATGIANLKLLAGNLIPYTVGNNPLPSYAPGLMAFWEQGIGNGKEIYAVVGRYDALGNVIWSEAVQLTQDGIADENLDVAALGNGVVDVVYQKSLALDPRNPQYAVNIGQLPLDAANPNRDDTDLYHSYVSVVLDDQGNPGLQVFDGATIPLTFNNPNRETAIYYPLGLGVQGISSPPPSGASPNSNGVQGPTAAFQAGATRGFELVFGNPAKMVNGRIGSSLFGGNFGLQLSGGLSMGDTRRALKATLNLQVSDYQSNPQKQRNPLGPDYQSSSNARKGQLFSVAGWGVGAVNFDTSGQVNYGPSGDLTGRQRAFSFGLDLFRAYKVNFGTPNFSAIQARGQIDFDLGFEVAYTFTDPKPGTKPPFTLNLPGWLSGITTGAGTFINEVAFLSASFNQDDVNPQVASGIAAIAGLGSNAPIIISAAAITMPPLVPWPGKGEYNKFGWGLEVPLEVKLTGTAGILNNTLNATVVATGQLAFDLEVDPRLGFSIPWQTGLQVSAQLGAFTIGWGITEKGTLVNTEPGPGSASPTFNPNNLAGALSPTTTNPGAITVSYNPYTGSTNHYQTPTSQATNQAQVTNTNTAQIGYVTLSNGGSNYLDGRSGSFQTYVPGSSTNDPALITVFVKKGVISSLTVADQGSGYGLGPLNLNLNATGGTGAAATITVEVTDNTSNTGRLSQVTVTNGGSGYFGGKSGTFVVSPTSTAANSNQPLNPGLLGVTVTNGVITAIGVIDAGSGYLPGQVAVDFSQNGGGGNGAVAQAQPINTQLGNVVNDGPPSISSITYGVNQSQTTATSMVWIADGVTDSTPLGQQVSRLGPATTRVQTALLSGTDWSEPTTIPGAGSGGFNTDPATGFYLDPLGNPVRVVVWSHADASGLTPNSTDEEITSAVLNSDIYFAVAPSGQAWSNPQSLAVNPGTDTKVALGAGATSSELIAAWVNTPLPNPETGETSQQIYAAVFNGQTQAWTTPTTIPNIGNATGKGIASLEIGEFLGNPALFWSDTTVPGYAYSVIQASPDLYFRLDNRPGATVAENAATGGQTSNAAYIGTVNLGQPGALLAANGSGDANTSAGFTGQGYVLAPSVDDQAGLGDFSVEFWVNFDNLAAGQSLVDQGIYNPDAVMPTATIPLTIVKTPTQQNGAWGYAYAATILPTTQVTVTQAGSGLSPFNLELTSLLPGTTVTAADGTVITLNGLPALDLNVSNQALSSITVPQATQILGSTFVANANAQNDTTSTSTVSQTLTYEAVPGWYIRTSENQNLVFNAGGGETTSSSLTPNTWYYVVATYNSSTQTAELYLNGTLVGQQIGSRFSPSSVPVLLGYNFQGRLDEVAYYNRLLTLDTTTVTLNSLGQASNLQTNSIGEITAHYQNRFNDPNAAEDATFYSVYNPQTQAWSTPIQFAAVAADTPTNPLLERSPVVDITSNSGQLGPDGIPDSRVQVQVSPQLVAPGVTITGIKVTSVDDPGLNWTVGNAPNPGWAIGVTINGQLINPLNPQTDFAYTVRSLNPTLDLYFQDSMAASDLSLGQTVNVTFYTQDSSGQSQPTSPITATIIPNPTNTTAQVTEAGRELVATGTILENEVTNLDQVNSGVVLAVPENAGKAVAAGKFLNGTVGLALSQPSAANGQGRVWVLPAGSTDALDTINLTPLSNSTPPPGGVLIQDSNVPESTRPPQIGEVLAVADIDGDGVEDLIIGALQARNSNGNQAGNVYILSGTSLQASSNIDLANNPGVTVFGAAGSQAGFAIATGDVNGDGADDIVIGAPYASVNGQAVGAAYLLLGGTNFFNTSTVNLATTTPLITGTSGSYQDPYLNTVTWTSQVGFSVAVSRGSKTQHNSINGDNFADIVIGAPNYYQQVEFNGQSINPNATTAQVQAYKNLLTTVANSGPGAPYSQTVNTGRAYLIFGGESVPQNLSDTSFNGSNGVVFDGSPILAGDAQVGWTVATGNDLNHDGFDDLLIGAPAGNNSTGLVYGIAGRNTGFTQTQTVLSYQANLVLGGSRNFANLGKTLSLRGDLNGDGLADMVLGAPDAEYSTGLAHVIFGKDTIFDNGTPTYISLQPGATSGVFNLNGGGVGQLAAASLWSGTDLNGDGIDDLLLGAPYGEQTYVVFGHQWLSEVGNLKLSKLANDQGVVLDQAGSGVQVANLGDINGDGFADTLLGLANTGATIVFGGGTQTLLDESLGTTNLQVTPFPNTTLALANPVGDFNGDGLEDVLVLANNTTSVGPISNGNLQVAQLTSGGLPGPYVVVWQSSNGSLVSTTSTDGQAWTTPTTIPNATTSTAPALVAIPGFIPAVFAFWAAGNGSMQVSFYNPVSNTWADTPTTTNNFGLETNTGVSVAYNSLTGKYFAAWVGTNGTIYASTSTNGTTWTQAQATPYVGNADSLPVVYSFNGQNFLYQSTTSGNSLSFYVSEFGSWNTLNLVAGSLPAKSGSSLTFAPVINANGESTLSAAYTDINGQVQYFSSSDGINWSAPTPQPLPPNLGPTSGTPGLINVVGNQSQVYVITAAQNGQAISTIQSSLLGQGTTNAIAITSPQISSLVLGNPGLGSAGNLGLSTALPTLFTNQTYTGITQAGDLNGDGFADVIFIITPNNPDSDNYNQLFIAFGNSAGMLNPLSLNVPNNTSVTAAGDINGDGIDDLVLGNGALNQGAGGVYALFGNPNLETQVNSTNPLSTTLFPGQPIVNAPAANGLIWTGDNTENINANFNSPNGSIGNTGLSTVVFNGEVVTIWVNQNNQLAFSTSSDGIDWNSGNLFPNAWQTDAVPGLVEFNNQLYAYWYYSGNGANSTAIYYAQYQGNGQWGGLGYTNLTNNSLNVSNGLGGGINLVEYNNSLFAIWQEIGNFGGNALYFSSSTDGINWASPQAILDAAIWQQESVPSLVVFQNTLYAYYVGVGGQGVFYTTYDTASNGWSPVQLISNLLANNNAITDFGLSVVNVADQALYMAWQGGPNNTNNLFIASSSDGKNWTVPDQIDNTYGWGIPSLYLSQNRLNLLSPAATANNISNTSIITTASEQTLIFPTGLGSNFAPLGDVNGDGYGDVVVYAPGFPNQTGTAGAAYVWFGAANGFAQSQVLLTGANLTTGISFASAGDVNGDGLDDILIGNPNYSSSTDGQNAGIAYVIFGASNLADLSSINLSDLQPVSTASGSVTDGKIGQIQLTSGGSGYLNGDSGTFNIEVSSSTSTQAGIIQATVKNGVITGIEVTNPGAGFTALTGLDYSFVNGGGGSGGSVSVTSLVSLAGFQIVGLPNSNSGEFLSGGGDVNGDGFDDLVIGAPGDNLSYILFGGDFAASVNQYGSIGDDVLQGTATGDVLMGQAGDDILLGNGGRDVLLGGSGDDWLQIRDSNFVRVDGGSGQNTLALYGDNGQAWDLTTLAPGNRLKNIQAIDIRNYGSNLLTLNQATILKLTDTNILTINGDSSDNINLSPGFTSSGTQYANGQTYNVYASGLAQAWINVTIPTSNITFTAPTTNTPAPVIQAGNVGTTAASTSVNATDSNQATTFQVSSPVVSENGKALLFQVTRTGDLSKSAAAQYRTINDTAQAGNHYHAQIGYLFFAPGETLKEVSIGLIDDQILGPRQRHLKLGLTALTDSAAPNLSQRSLNFENQSGSQLRNLGLNLISADNPLSQTTGLPFNQINFNVSTVNGPKTTVTLPLAGLTNLNSFYRFNPTTSQFGSFFFDGNTGVEFLDTSGDGQTDTLKLHLEDGGRGDSDGVVNGVVSGFNAPGQVTPGPLEVNPGIFLIPTSYDGQLQFQNLNLAALGNPELGIFAVDDAQGRIGGLLPTDPGYFAAAQARQQVLLANAATASPNAITPQLATAALIDPSKLIPTELQANGEFVKTQLTGNQHYGFYWNQAGQTQLSINNPDFAATEDQRGYTTLAWGQQQWEMVSTVLVTPGQAGETLNATLELARAAAHTNTVALFRVDSLTGGLDTTKDGQIDLRPGDVGYAEAALQRAQDPLTGRILETISLNFSKINQSVTLAGASMYGLALISNGTVSDFLSQNPTNAATGPIHSFFNFEAANPDATAHVRRLGQNLWGFEDLFGGGDRDFNDMLLSVAWQQ